MCVVHRQIIFTGYNAKYNTNYADSLFEHVVKIGLVEKVKRVKLGYNCRERLSQLKKLLFTYTLRY